MNVSLRRGDAKSKVNKNPTHLAFTLTYILVKKSMDPSKTGLVYTLVLVKQSKTFPEFGPLT